MDAFNVPVQIILWTHSMCPYKFYYSSCQCVRDWSGILCEPCGNGDGNGDWGRGRGREMGNGSGESEQRYSGKPDGVAGTPKVN